MCTIATTYQIIDEPVVRRASLSLTVDNRKTLSAEDERRTRSTLLPPCQQLATTCARYRIGTVGVDEDDIYPGRRLFWLADPGGRIL